MSRHDAGFRGAWSHRRWRWLLASAAVSGTVHELTFVVLVVVVIDRTGSAGWLGVATVARVALVAVLAPLAGAIADRWRRRRVIVGFELVRAAVMLAMAGLVAVGTPIVVIVVLTVVSSALTLPCRAAALAATADVVDVDDLAAAHAVGSVVGELTYFVGPACGAVIAGVSGPGRALVVGGALVLVSAWMVVRAGDLGGGRSPDTVAVTGAARDAHDGRRRSVWLDITETAGEIGRRRGLLGLLVIAGMVMLVAGAERVAHALVAVDIAGQGADWVGVMGAAAGAGGLVVTPWATRLCASRRSATWVLLGAVAYGLMFGCLAFGTSMPALLVILVIGGAGSMVFEVVFITLLQRWSRDGLMARIVGMNESVRALTEMGGAIAATLLITGPGLRATVLVIGGVAALACVATISALRRESAGAEAALLALVPRVELLRRIALFEGASQAGLERVARCAVDVTVHRGDCVIREGADADTIYVVVEGELVASSAGRGELSRMGPDDWFGEIGVIGRRPRTASVHAVTDGVLVAIDAGAFLAAVGGGALRSGGALTATMSRRLARTDGAGPS